MEELQAEIEGTHIDFKKFGHVYIRHIVWDVVMNGIRSFFLWDFMHINLMFINSRQVCVSV